MRYYEIIDEGRSWKNEPGRCTMVTLNAILDHFGKLRHDGARAPIHGTGVLRVLFDAGLKVAPVYALGEKNPSVKTWILAHPNGAFYINTSGHAMAVIDGTLFDATERGPDRRIVQSALEVYETDDQRHWKNTPIVIKVDREES